MMTENKIEQSSMSEQNEPFSAHGELNVLEKM